MFRRLPRLFTVAALAFVGSAQPAIAAFSPPTRAERAAALGDLTDVPPALRPLLTPDDDFELIPLPEPGDWLLAHPERGQSFSDYLAERPLRLTPARRVLALQPLGKFSRSTAPSLETVRRYAAAFFQTDARILPTHALDALDFAPRVNPQTKQVQRLTTAVLDFLFERVPADAFCVLGVTLEDLYPSASWNYVFGQASLTRRVGVYSFARYDPDFFDEGRPKDWRDQLLRRSCKVLVHETGHMFGLRHCVYYGCVMNGSNHLAETDSRPLHLCPVCLRKLQNGTGFDAVKRYRELAAFYRAQGWTEDAQWCERQAAKTPPVAEPRP